MSMDQVRRILRQRGHARLADLLRYASVRVYDAGSPFSDPEPTIAEVRVPVAACDELRALPDQEQKLIVAALNDVSDSAPLEPGIETVIYKVQVAAQPEDPIASTDLLEEIQRLKAMMVAVATGGPMIRDVNSQYQGLYGRIGAALRDLGVDNPNPYADLWDWYGKWSSGDLPTYGSRRVYITDLFAPLERLVRERERGTGPHASADPTGWPRVDRALGEMRTTLERANTEEQFQAVGLLCREILISLAQTVYDPNRHPPVDEVLPSDTDAKRMLDVYIAVELAGKSAEAARRHAKASLDLANDLQHDRTARFRDAALCGEATASVVNIIAVVSGRRDPDLKVN